MTGTDFAQALARQLGIEPLDEREIATLLRIASVAAHASERLAAPLCTYLAGRSGRPPGDILAEVDRLAGTGTEGDAS